MKISVNTYSFNRVTNKDGERISQMEMIDTAAKIGFDAIEFSGISVPEGVDKTPIEYAADLKAHADELGLGISAYTVGADFFSPDVVENLKNEVLIAEALGTGRMRHDICYSLPEGKTYFDCIPEFAPKISEVADFAKKHGVMTCTENHGYVSQDADRVVGLVRAVNNPNFGLLVDFGNFMCADEISVESVPKAVPYAVHVHAKDFLYKSKEESESAPAGYFGTRGGNWICGCSLGEGVVNVPECVKIVKESGYDGYITVEFEGPFGDPLEGIIKGYRCLRSLL